MLLVFADDWGRHPSSCQHLVNRLLPRHGVTWVNTIGMRPPTLDWATIRRAGEKFREWNRPKDSSPAKPLNPFVLAPKMWPWFRRRHDRWLNRMLLERQLRPLIEAAEEPVHAITTVPIVADLMDRIKVADWTYYCVDDFSSWPGLDQATMEIMERDVISRCDAAIAVSSALVARVAERGKAAQLLEHGVDVEFWRSEGGSQAKRFRELESPLVVFWGVIDRRMNVEWVRKLAGDMSRGSILLVGPLDSPDPALLELPRVTYHPTLPLADLPRLAAQADVLVMPYADLPVTRAMQPLKLKEYMATGRPVVAASLPATAPWGDCIDISSTAEDFSAAVRHRITAGVTAEQKIARMRLMAESWEEKASEFEAIILGSDQVSVHPATTKATVP